MKHVKLEPGIQKNNSFVPSATLNGPRNTRIVGLAGYSGSGKTTLITQIIPRLLARKLTVSTLKYAHCGFDLDQPGKDPFFHRQSGATEVVVSSSKRFAILHELREEPEWGLLGLIARMSPVDLVLVEGYKREPIPKIEVHRAANGKPLIYPEDPYVAAIATDIEMLDVWLPIVDLADIDSVTELLLQFAVPVVDIQVPQRA